MNPEKEVCGESAGDFNSNQQSAISRQRRGHIYGKTHNYLDIAGGEDTILASGVEGFRFY